MRFYELVTALSAKLESTDAELIRRARASWNPRQGSLDGDFAGQIMDRMRIALPSFSDDLKRDAYNEIADAEGLDRIDADEVNFDSWIHEALLDPVIEMLMETEGGDNFPAQRSLH
jgi:hypothetical protein